MFINVPLGIVALIILALKVKESWDYEADKAVDIAGAITIALCLALLTFGFLSIPALGFKSSRVYLTLLGGVTLLILFLFIEKKSKHPMMPLYLFSNPVFTGVNLLTFFLYAGLGAGMLFMSLNLVQMQGYSQLQSGLTFLPFTVLMITIARFAGTLADKYGPRLLLIIGPATAGTGLLLLSFVKQTSGPAEYWTTFFPGIIVLGLGMSFTVAPLTATVMTSVSNHLSGTASGVNNALTRISNVFANAILGALAVLLFAGALQNQLATKPLDPKVKALIIKEAANLGNAKVPKEVDPQYKKMISADYGQSFINAYSGIMKISAGLGFLGALMTVIFIRNKTLKKE